jgi:hypothetical protein
LYKRNSFVLEAKQSRQEHGGDKEVLGQPDLFVSDAVSSSLTGSPSAFTWRTLGKPEVRKRLVGIRTEPMALDPAKKSARVTRSSQSTMPSPFANMSLGSMASSSLRSDARRSANCARGDAESSTLLTAMTETRGWGEWRFSGPVCKGGSCRHWSAGLTDTMAPCFANSVVGNGTAMFPCAAVPKTRVRCHNLCATPTGSRPTDLHHATSSPRR